MLKPCPFCGIKLEEHPWTTAASWHPLGTQYCLLGGIGVMPDDADRWNTRASPWIPVSEGTMPKKKGWYVVKCHDGDHDWDHFDTDYFDPLDEERHKEWKTHNSDWMEIPI